MIIDDRFRAAEIRQARSRIIYPAANADEIARNVSRISLQPARRSASAWTEPSPPATRSAVRRAADRRLTRRVAILASVAIVALGAVLGVL
jgi:hypothetical protein